jgi:hypothetical protein
MATHEVITTDTEIDQALNDAQNLQAEPRVAEVQYKSGPELDILILKLSDGHRHLIPREDLEGLQGATPEQIAQVEVLGNGTGLRWPALNLDHYIPSLLQNVYGTKRWMEQIGLRGGSIKSAAKRRSSQANGLKGGRPRLAAARA